MTTLKSKSAVGANSPLLHYIDLAWFPPILQLIFIAETFGAPVILPIGKEFLIASITEY